VTITNRANPGSRSLEDSRPPLRVLLLAEACNPAWASVPLVGYNFARALARHPRLDVTLATQIRNSGNLDGDVLTATARVEYIDTEWVARGMYKLGRRLRGGEGLAWTIDTALSVPGYYAFEREVLRRFRSELTGPEGFHLVHRITPVNPVTPSPLVSKIAKPMVIGPLNGGLPFPAEFSAMRRSEREWLAALRWAHRLLPHARRSYKELAGLLVGSTWTSSQVPRCFRGEQLFLPENGIDPDIFPIAEGWTPPKGRFQFVSVGRLTPLKGFDMVIEAMAGSPKLRQAGLTIVGDGPERAALEDAVRGHGLQDNVALPGWLAQTDVAAELERGQAFVFASVKDFGGGAVLEAMAAGLPSIVLDYGGPADLVGESSGLRVPMAPRDELVAGIRASMERLLDDHELCRRLGRAAAETVRAHYTWDAKADRIVSFYDEMLDQAGHSPVRRIGRRATARQATARL
jgi:glycosyltransferase involved in cell wall biosynthesis